MVKVLGYVVKFEIVCKKGVYQYFFVNGCYMCYFYFYKVVMDVYEQLIFVGEQIFYFIYFEVDFVNIDVNIYFIKIEIKFENEQVIWQIFFVLIKELLGKFNVVFFIDFDMEDMFDIFVFEQNLFFVLFKVYFNFDFNLFKFFFFFGGGNYFCLKVDWEDLYGGFEKVSKMNQFFFDFDFELEEFVVIEEESIVIVVFEIFYVGELVVIEKGMQYLQFKGCFIFMFVKFGLMLIDQYCVYICVFFDCYCVQIQQKQGFL